MAPPRVIAALIKQAKLRKAAESLIESLPLAPEQTVNFRTGLNIEDLHAVAKWRPVEWVDAGDLPAYSQSRRDGYGPRRQEAASDAVPILVSEDLSQILDGRHRAQKWQQAGHKKLPIVRIPSKYIDQLSQLDIQ